MTVHMDGKSIYDIAMEQSFDNLARETGRILPSGRKLCIVTDSNVAPLYLDEVTDRLSGVCRELTVFTMPAGEEYKNLDVVRDLYQHLIVNQYHRNDLLLALGGGVVGDLCGFAAATYLRGIGFIQVPTTLLSQVDSSIGGKTGVDFDSYKNMVGAFHMPRLVYINTATLRTLPDGQFSSGMGEVIKHGLIRDLPYYHWLKDHASEIMARDLDACAHMINGSDMVKCLIVEQDPKEQGDRALLNFGHTLGHAIEKLSGFDLSHGHCVGLGALAAAKISAERGMIPDQAVEDIRKTLELFSLPVSLPQLDIQSIIQATKHDKKMDSRTLRFILLRHMGEAYIDTSVTEEEMEEALQYLADGERS